MAKDRELEVDGDLEETQVEAQAETKEPKELGFEWNEKLEALASGKPLAETDEEPEDEVRDEEETEAEAEAEAPVEAWYDDDVKAIADTYGLTEDDLKGFSGKEEFDRATSFWDRQAKSLYQQKQEPAPSKEEPAEEKEPLPRDEYGFIDPEYYRKNEFSDETIALVESLRESQEQLAAMQRQQMIVQQQAELNAFHDAVDSFDPKFYGSSLTDDGMPANLNEDLAGRRQKLLEETYAVAERIARRQEASGQPVRLPPWRVLIKQADNIVFGEERRQEEQGQRMRQIQNQSRRRRPVATNAAASPAVRRNLPNPRDPREIAADPDIIKFWERANS